ncbi:LuxR C-terminal-related transcriptional regulator [Kutzneria buriramensis]|uniref:DNA-binding NarL/FixJ family response regulator n=1 Tax=Kutzneria buriramensis TaxID=1045776 RepID=A0A3E0HFE9_9PSEU|nr:LuxR C-terminal-related transcriptional regulator [Kutzneria buriramensis]REH43893.1 DNA-binding NarL/FixJ family response regulator [Kutzneria buriramensis]
MTTALATVSSIGPRAAQVFPVRLAVEDALTKEAVAQAIGAHPRLRLTDEPAQGEVLLAITNEVTDELLTGITEGSPVLLVADRLGGRQLLRGLHAGVVSFLPRRSTDLATITKALVTTGEGRSVLPPSVARLLVDHLRRIDHVLITTTGYGVAGLDAREVEVLKLVAQGAENADIARELRYSEHTIKRILKDLLSRHNLQNRAHAVAYALRIGAI